MQLKVNLSVSYFVILIQCHHFSLCSMFSLNYLLYTPEYVLTVNSYCNSKIWIPRNGCVTFINHAFCNFVCLLHSDFSYFIYLLNHRCMTLNSPSSISSRVSQNKIPNFTTTSFVNRTVGIGTSLLI